MSSVPLYITTQGLLSLFWKTVTQGSHPTWKTWNFVFFLSRPRKCQEFAQKVVKTWNFNSKPGKNLNFDNSMFQASLFKMSFTKIILIYFFVISTLSTQTLICSQIDLGFHCFYLENTWNFVSQEKWEPCYKTFPNMYFLRASITTYNNQFYDDLAPIIHINPSL